MATEVVDRVLVMVTGQIAIECDASALASDEAMQRRYSGVSMSLGAERPVGGHET